MNRFIFQTIKYLLLTFTLLSIYILVFDVYFNVHDKKKLFSNEVESTKIIITGTSHTLWGLNPELFEFKTINISEINKPIIIDLEIIKKYYEKTPKLEYVIIPIDYFTLFYTGDSDACAKRYWHHWGFNNKKKHVFHFIDCKIPTPADLFTQKNEKLSNFTICQGVYNSSDGRTNMLARIESWHNHWMSLKNHVLVTGEILQFISFCKSKKIKIVFVKMPIPLSTQVEFDETYTSMTNKSLKILSEFSNTYLIDLNKISVFENDSLFHDCDHLNYRGAKLASSILNNKIISIANKGNVAH